MNRRVCVRGIIQKDGKLFCQKLKKGEVEHAYWCTPGGGLDDGESLHDGLRREMIEETGVAPEIGKLLYIQQYGDGEQEYLEFFFEVTNVDDYAEEIDLAATSHGHIEVSQYGFIDPAGDTVLPEFLQQQDIAGDRATGGSAKIFSYL